jgi:hypothetical protein
MDHEHQKPLFAAILRLLRPLVRILLSRGVSYGTFADLTKWIYVDVARKEFGIKGRKQSTSRVSVVTGLSRKEVMRVRQLPRPDDRESIEKYNRAARVIAAWLRESDFQDAEGEPASLPIAGPGVTFSELVKRFSGDVPVRAILDELIRVGAVERLEDGRICLLTRAYIPESSDADKLHILGTDAGHLISTIGHNLKPDSIGPLFQRKVAYDNLPDEVLPAFRLSAIEMSIPQLKALVVTGRELVFTISKNHTQMRKIEMKTYHLKTLALVLLSALLLISYGGCGGGGTKVAGGGIGGSGIITAGAITAFGSIVVNGTEFDTSNADDIVLDNLDIGMVVTVEGTGSIDSESAVADRVIYNDNVEGPIESITVVDTTRKDIVVLGQTVIANAVTVFKGTTFDDIAVNDVVEVSGLSDDTGDIWATFLEKTDGVIFEVTGFVENLIPVQETFKINDLTVDYSSADTSGLPGGVPTDGLLVEIEGTLDPITGEMLADVIELGDELDAEDADEIEVTGFVTDRGCR